MPPSLGAARLAAWRPEIVVVDVQGNVGVGKSTLVRTLVPRALAASTLRDAVTVVVEEPVAAFVDVRDGLTPGTDVDGALYAAVTDADASMLAPLYRAEAHSALAFQFYVLAERTRALRAGLERALAAAPARVDIVYVVTERSLDADRYIFAQALADGGRMTPGELLAYDRTYRVWCDALPCTQRHAACVYVWAPADACRARISRRRRDGEHDRITDAYLHDLHARHERVYGGATLAVAGKTHVPVTRLDTVALGDYTDDGATAARDAYVDVLTALLNDVHAQTTA
jgi:deoxyadenosine/deoxycytidine kinase